MPKPKAPYTVGSLKKALAELDESLIIVLSSDSEGNSYNVLHSISSTNIAFNPKTRDIGLVELTNPMIDLGYTTEDICYKGKPAAVFYP